METQGKEMPQFLQGRRRHHLNKSTMFNINRPALNLTVEEYDKLREEIKKRGNMG